MTAPDGYKVVLTLTEAQFEDGVDALFVRDGQDSSATALGAVTGSPSVPIVLTSSGRFMDLVFFSDNSVEFAGFYGIVTFVSVL